MTTQTSHLHCPSNRNSPGHAVLDLNFHTSSETTAECGDWTASACPPEGVALDVRVLAADGDPQVRQSIAAYLADHDMQVTTLQGGRDVEALIMRDSIDLLILDQRLRGEDGLRIAQRVRKRWSLPIIMLTTNRDEADRVMALELAVDDYLTKPFSLRELLARIRALLRRAQARDTAAPGRGVRSYRFAGWELNVPLRRLTRPGGQTLTCTSTEFNLLVAFLSAPRTVLSRDQLLGLTRLHDGEVYDRAIDVAITRLRKKIEPPGTPARFIRTERGAGYVFDAAVAVAR